ncbi:MAG TPA: short-chain fatty acyl-CoA regulator family protein [Candidatus Angelobacter sp.]|nr:short-chain fatty acyl-CoA regulator family protein [Candidatus Angelobacter sp.]
MHAKHTKRGRQAEPLRLGRRVRRLREQLGLTQVAMARRLDLSASYLNLIEHDQRPLTSKLARRLSEALQVGIAAFSETESGRIANDVAEALADPVFGERVMTQAEIRDGVGASAGLGRALLDLYRAYRQARERADRLGEELRNREVLAGVNYEFRGIVAAIRSLAEILQDNPDLESEQRRRFIGIIVEDSKRLVPLFGGLLDADGGLASDVDQGLPSEDVADFLLANTGYFAELEQTAEEARGALGSDEAAGPDFEVPEMLSLEARKLAVAKALAMARCGEVIERCVDRARWVVPEARAAAVSALADYVAAAILMPYDAFFGAAKEVRHDIERLQRRFGVGFEQVCRRLTTLQRPGARGVPFYIVKVDMAGNVTWRLGSAGVRVPRFGAVCPLWNVHAAFLTPGVTRAQLSRMPDGTTYFSFARAIRGEEPEIVGSPRFSAIELGCDVSFGRDIVYADGFDLGAGAAAVPVGTTCRLCERADCTARVLPPLRAVPAVAAAAVIR